MKHVFSTALAMVAIWLGLGVAVAAREPLRVVASIKPVHALVAGVMAGAGEPTLLVTGGRSPHAYALRPSEARALERADVVFWVGDALETFLQKPLRALSGDARIVALHQAEGVVLLDTGETGDGRDHDHGAVDMHIWLDPINAKAMVSAIAAALGDADPDRAAVYAANAERLRARLDRLDAELAADLAPVAGRRYVVFHDAYRYFEKRYRLSPVGAITVNPARQPGARTVRAIRERITDLGAVCVFGEPQFEPALVAAVIEGTSARPAVLDPLGADLEPGVDAYFTLMRNLAKSLVGCLAPAN
jgi:zinc transport system substrate-binding protein